jgi:ATP/maltotriose-dependent transcriptional regulator MalT
MDEASAAALSFAVRRLQAERVAVLIAIRDNADEIFSRSSLPSLTIHGLQRDASVALLARASGSPVRSDIAERIYRDTAGNPLALLDNARHLGEVSPDTAEYEPLPIGPKLSAAYNRRLAKLAAPTRRALTLAAANYRQDSAVLTDALSRCNLDCSAIETAETAGILELNAGRCAFTHPLLRAAAYHGASGKERREAHRVLAACLAERDSPLDRDQHAWHLAAAVSGQDADAARALADFGSRARTRGALHAGSRAYERAATLATEPGARGYHLLDAAETAYLGGQGARALSLLRQASDVTEAPEVLAASVALRSQIELVRLPPRQVHQRLVHAAASIEVTNPTQAARLLVAAACAACMGGAIGEARTSAEHAASLTRNGDVTIRQIVAVLRGHTMMLSGESAHAADLFRDCQPFLLEVEPLSLGVEVTSFAAMSMMWLGRHGDARAVLDRAIAQAREAAATERLPPLLSVLAETRMRTGHWNEAYALAEEASQVAVEIGQPALQAYALSTLARIEAAQGKSEACRGHAALILTLIEGQGADLVSPYAEPALALLDLGTGRAVEAAARLQELRDRMVALGLREPAVLRFHEDLVASSIAAGDSDQAADVLTDLEQQVKQAPSPWGRAACAHCRALLADQPAAHEAFAEAIELYVAAQDPFSRARVQLAYGRRLRRDRKRGDARRPLVAAFRVFERLYARPWMGMAEAELRAAGFDQLLRQKKESVELTTQEKQVATMVAHGRTNREVAAALFLSVKTVEYHLGHIYEKMHIRSRVALARQFERAS